LNGSALSLGDVVVKPICNDPWQQLVDAIDGMLGDASDDVAQVGLGYARSVVLSRTAIPPCVNPAA
jgi:hypothetical protein